MTNVRWVIPEAKEPKSNGPAAELPKRTGDTSRLRIGLLDNTKDNGVLLMQLLGEDVCRALDAEMLPPRRKPNPAVGATPDMLNELAREADCVLTAMAD